MQTVPLESVVRREPEFMPAYRFQKAALAHRYLVFLQQHNHLDFTFRLRAIFSGYRYHAVMGDGGKLNGLHFGIPESDKKVLVFDGIQARFPSLESLESGPMHGVSTPINRLLRQHPAHAAARVRAVPGIARNQMDMQGGLSRRRAVVDADHTLGDGAACPIRRGFRAGFPARPAVPSPWPRKGRRCGVWE